MVYCGKPSKGCQTCRQRKIRCDQKPDGCSQCAKVQKECPGYRVQLDLMFRNESTAVVKKAKAKEALKKSKALAATTAPAATTTLVTIPKKTEQVDQSFLVKAKQRDWTFPRYNKGPPANAALPSPSAGPSIMPSLVDAASGFFIQNFVIGLANPNSGAGDRNALVPPAYSESCLGSHLVAGMRAVGFASFSNIVGAPEIMKLARQSYTVALRGTNAALRSPTEAVKDSTLLSIMVLGLFETVTGYNQRSLAAWAAHINGAAALVNMRGVEQLYNPNGLRMFIQVTNSLLISCIQRELPLPHHIIELKNEAAKFVDPRDPAWRVQDMVIAFVDFRARLKDGSLRNPKVILQQALEIDGAFIDIFSKLPRAWGYQEIFTDKDPTMVWNGRYHIYGDYWVAQIWNAMRTCRILLNEVIREVFIRGFAARPPVFLDPVHLAQYQVSTDVLFTLREDILASVPQHLGYEPAKTPDQRAAPSFARFKDSDTKASKIREDEIMTDADAATNGEKPSRIPSAFTAFDMEDTSNDNIIMDNHPSNRNRLTEASTPGSIGSSDGKTPQSEQTIPPSPSASSTTSSSAKAPLPMLRGSGGYFLLWPLYLVGAMDIATEDVRTWVCQCLRTIGGTMGIFQAIALAGFLERHEDVNAFMAAQNGRATTDAPKTESRAPGEARRTIFGSP